MIVYIQLKTLYFMLKHDAKVYEISSKKPWSKTSLNQIAQKIC